MKHTADNSLLNALEELVALSVENQIKLEALEQVWLKTNPMIHELYIGEVETITKEKAAKLNVALTKALKERLKERKKLKPVNVKPSASGHFKIPNSKWID